MKTKQIKAEELEIGKKYWIVQKGFKNPDTIRPLIYIGQRNIKEYWFTFGKDMKQLNNNFNLICSKSSYKFYEEGAFK